MSGLGSTSHLATSILKEGPILLQFIQPRDAPILAHLLASPGAALDFPYMPPLGVPEARRKIVAIRDRAKEPTVYLRDSGKVLSGPTCLYFSVRVQPENRMVGIVGFDSVEEVDREDGYRVGNAVVLIDALQRGKGYGKRALEMLFDWGFTSARNGGLQLKRVHMVVDDSNKPMVGFIMNKLPTMTTKRNYEKRQVTWQFFPETWAIDPELTIRLTTAYAYP